MMTDRFRAHLDSLLARYDASDAFVRAWKRAVRLGRSEASWEPVLEFMLRYIEYSRVAMHCPLHLMGQIAASNLFMDKNDACIWTRDRSSEIVVRLNAATNDDFGGSGGKSPSHRTLAQVLLRSWCKVLKVDPTTLNRIALTSADLKAHAGIREAYGVGKQLTGLEMLSAIAAHQGGEHAAAGAFPKWWKVLINEDNDLRSQVHEVKMPFAGYASVTGDAYVGAHNLSEPDHNKKAQEGVELGMLYYAGSESQECIEAAIENGLIKGAQVESEMINSL